MARTRERPEFLTKSTAIRSAPDPFRSTPVLSAAGQLWWTNGDNGLISGSPAIGAGSSFSVGGATIITDQRGVPRPNSITSAYDMGAFQTPNVTTPTGLTATGVSFEQINLAWTNTPLGQTGFYVERSSDGTNYSIIATLGATADTYSDNETYLQPGATYYYKVAAFNSLSTSSYTSAVAGVTVLPDLPSYSAPSSHPTLPTGADDFNAPIASQTLVSGVPTIAASNLDAGPDDTLSLTGSAFTDDGGSDFADTRFIVYGQTRPDERNDGRCPDTRPIQLWCSRHDSFNRAGQLDVFRLAAE